MAQKSGFSKPNHPLYFLKAPNAFAKNGDSIPRPSSYDGRIIFEGELGAIIGRRCHKVSTSDAAQFIFGYKCVNDVTALELLNQEPTFPQWTRSKGFDGFAPFGPCIATDLDASAITIKSIRDGRERRNYSVADLFLSPFELVSAISSDMTLVPGDVISCGTSTGTRPMKSGARIEIFVDGIGTLSNIMG